jgi:putative restriction endonuclease
VKGYVAVTDHDWYTFLRGQRDLQEVNSWQPSGGRKFKAVPHGAPFFFKLHSPHNAIAGFGFFARHSTVPAWYAWDTFGPLNGAANLPMMLERIQKYNKHRDSTGQYNIGCIMISKPVFFSPNDWIKQPNDWQPPTVQGATYDLTEGEGRRIWEECQQRMPNPEIIFAATGEGIRRYGDPVLIVPRLGQGTFRVAITDAYRRCCAVTGERALPVLDAIHIKPYSDGGEHLLGNGLLLRTDIHKLFDMGYVTVTPQYHFEASRKLKTDFDNGEIYREYHGRAIHLPNTSTENPDPNLLKWHNDNVFRG